MTCFEGLGCLPGELHLEVDPDIRPVQQVPRRIPIPLKHKVTEAIQSMEKNGIIKRVQSQHNGSATWLS